MVVLGPKSTELWDKKLTGRWRRGHVENDKPPLPWPSLSGDGRTMIIGDPVAAWAAAADARRALQKKQYEDHRRTSPSFRVPRCPFKGEGPRHRPFSRSLFTVSNFLTSEDCERLITAAASRCRRYGTRNAAAGVWFVNYTPHQLDALNMWTRELKAVFADIRITEESGAFAVGVHSRGTVVRYENGEGHEARSPESLYKQFSEVSPKFYKFHGYHVLVYLNGSRRGGAGDVVGGETLAFDERPRGSGDAKQQIAEIVPETGMAVCIALGQHTHLTEFMPVTNGALYTVEFYVEFSNYTDADIAKYKAEHPRKGKRRPA